LELRDLLVTPLLLIAIFFLALFIRPYVTDPTNKKYFFSALTVKIIGAIALGLIYQFYYGGGDTFIYHTHGSRIIWEAFLRSPSNGIKIFFSNGEYGPGLWDAADKIWYWRDPQSYAVIRIAALFDMITFSAYAGTAILFAVLSFIGGWLLFLTFYKIHQHQHKWIALSCLFVPSVIFWGSGILKDTVTLAFLGIATFCIYKIFIDKRMSSFYIILAIFSFYTVFSIKKYILISFLIGVIVWLFASYFDRFKSRALRLMLIPVVVAICGLMIYFTINEIVKNDPKYALDKIAETSRITAYDIRYGWGARTGDGSGYTLGELDGTFRNMLSLAPQAINVTLFRPYPWEIKNPLMAFSALESLLLLVGTIYCTVRFRKRMAANWKSPQVLFCLTFSLIFAFGVGVSTYNFGSLARYKIPLLPFYLVGLSLLSNKRTQEVSQ
jgi:hypothetical protein